MTYQTDTPPVSKRFEPVSMQLEARGFLTAAPALKRALKNAAYEIEMYKGKPSAGFCLTVPSSLLEPAFRNSLTYQGMTIEPMAEGAIVLTLPAEFESLLPSLSTTQPDFYNRAHNNLQAMDTCLILGVSNEKTTGIEPVNQRPEIRIKETDLYDVLTNVSCKVFNDEAPPFCWIPLVILAGGSAALGAFALGEVDFWCLQASCDACRSYRPEAVYTPAELHAAQQNATHMESITTCERSRDSEGREFMCIPVMQHTT